MKVVIFETEEWEEQACLRLAPAHDVKCTRSVLDARTAASYPDAEIISTFINSKLGADVLARFPALKLIATRSTGYDHIDLGWCRGHRIAVANVPDYGDSTVAEHAFALLLAVARHLVESVIVVDVVQHVVHVEQVRDGAFPPFRRDVADVRLCDGRHEDGRESLTEPDDAEHERRPDHGWKRQRTAQTP